MSLIVLLSNNQFMRIIQIINFQWHVFISLGLFLASKPYPGPWGLSDT